MGNKNLEFIFKEIVDLYGSLVHAISLATKNNLIDRNILAEGLVVKICEIYFERPFKLLEVRYPGFDIKSEVNSTEEDENGFVLTMIEDEKSVRPITKIFVQVTSQSDMTKKIKSVKKTIKKKDEELSNLEKKIGLKDAKKYILYLGYDIEPKKVENDDGINVISMKTINEELINDAKDLNNFEKIMKLFKLLRQYRAYYKNIETEKLLLIRQKEFIKNQLEKIGFKAPIIEYISFVREYYLLGDSVLEAVKKFVIDKFNKENNSEIIIIDPNIANLIIFDTDYRLKLLPHKSEVFNVMNRAKEDNAVLCQEKYNNAVNLLKTKLIKQIYEGKLLIFNPFHFIDANVEEIQ